jgi:DNA-binding beta-propeller fold protein YncE
MTPGRLHCVALLLCAGLFTVGCGDGAGPDTDGTGQFWDAGTGRYLMVHMTGGSPPYRYIDPANGVGTDLDSLTLELRVDGRYRIVVFPHGVTNRPTYHGYWAASGADLGLASLDPNGTHTTGTIGAQVQIANVQALMPDLEFFGIGTGPGVPIAIDFERTRDEPIELDYARSRLITGDGVAALAVGPDGTVLAIGSELPYLFHAAMPFTLPAARWVLANDLRDVAVAPDGGTAFLVHDGSSIIFYDLATATSVGSVSFPGQPIRVRQAGGRLFATVGVPAAPDSVYRVDPVTRAIVARAELPFAAQGLAVSDDGSKVYVGGGNALAVYDGATLTLIGVLPIAATASGIALSADGGTVYVSHAGSSIDVWDLATATQTATFAVPGTIVDIERQPGTGYVFASSSPWPGTSGGSVYRVNPANPSDSRTYLTDGVPGRIAFSLSGSALVANQRGWVDELW